MDFNIYLKNKAEKIEQYLDNYFLNYQKNVVEINSRLTPLIQVLIDGCKGGKKLRGALVCLGYEIAGGDNKDSILAPAVSYEIFNTAILSDDDIIDLSQTRRGKPSLYMQLGGGHSGMSHSIILSDIGYFLSFELLSNSHFIDSNKNNALRLLSKNMIDTGLGELLDVNLSGKFNEVKEDEVIIIASLKTAQYTISGPMKLGAVLAGAKAQQLIKLDNFGQSLGLAFQIHDDILGIYGDEKTLGKSVTSDITEGKNTLLIIYALKKANLKQKKILDIYYGNPKINNTGVEAIKNVFIETGALDYSKQKAVEYVVQAKQVIPKITKDKRLQNLLNEMADFLISRDK